MLVLAAAAVSAIVVGRGARAIAEADGVARPGSDLVIEMTVIERQPSVSDALEPTVAVVRPIEPRGDDRWRFVSDDNPTLAIEFAGVVRAAPRLRCRPGEPAAIFMGQVVPWLTRGADGCWSLVEDPSLRAGVSIDVTARRDEPGMTLALAVTREVVVDRRPAAGTGLPVGVPVIASSGVRTTASLDPGARLLVRLPQLDRRHPALAIVVAVRSADEPPQ